MKLTKTICLFLAMILVMSFSASVMTGCSSKGNTDYSDDDYSEDDEDDEGDSEDWDDEDEDWDDEDGDENGGGNSGGTTASKKTSSKSTKSKTTSSKTASTGSASSKTANDSNTIEIVAWWDETPKKGDELGDRMVKRRADLENKYGVKFKYTTMESADVSSKFVTEVMAGGTFGDFVIMRNYWAFPAFIKKGYLLSMSDYFDFSDPAFNAFDTKLATYENKVYGFSMEPPGLGAFMYFNKSIFQKCGIPEPYNLYKNGTWTWTKFFEIARTLKNNGYMAINPLDNYGYADAVIDANGGSYVEYVNGKPKSNLTHTGTIKGIDVVRQAVYIDKICEPWPDHADYLYPRKQFQSGKIAMLSGSYVDMTFMKSGMSDKYGVMPMPKDESMAKYVNMQRERHIITAAVTSNKEKMKKIMPILYEYYKPFDDSEALMKRVYETYTWDKESVDIIQELLKTQTVSMQDNFGLSYWNIVVPAVAKAVRGEVSATAAMKAVEDSWQAAILK